MQLHIDLTAYCDSALAEQGLTLLQQQEDPALQQTKTDSGSLRCTGWFVDSFNFVDHPWLQVDPTGTRLEAFGCDCPDGRSAGKFCVHCAALARAEYDEKVAPKQEEEHREPELLDLSYQFSNSRYHLYPNVQKPRIPLERFIQVYGDNARARQLFNRVKAWGGSCSGFVFSSSMLHQTDSGIDVTDFNPLARIPSQLALSARNEKIGMTLLEFVEAAHVLQYGHSFWIGHPIKTLADATEAFQKGQGRPVGMAIYSALWSNDGHAVLPYRLERTEESEDILHIYDPNYPKVTRFAYLEKDAEGNYINWRFDMSDIKTYASKTGGQLYLAFYDVYKKAWDNRGGEPKNLLGIKPGMAVADQAGQVLARMTEEGPETFSDDIMPLPVMGSGAKDMLMSVPAGAFRVIAEDPMLEELKVQLLGVNLTLELATEAREAEISVDDATETIFARIPEGNVRYGLEILNSLAGDAEKTVLTGVTGQQTLTVAQKSSRLYANGLPEQVVLYINDQPAPLTVIGQLEEQTPIVNKPTDPQE